METGNHLHRKKRFGNMNSNSSHQQQPELKFIEGSAELLDNVRPLWKKLNALHAEKSPHFADAFAKTKFLERKEELKNKEVRNKSCRGFGRGWPKDRRLQVRCA